MSTQDILKNYTHAFKASYPAVTAEGVMCYAIVAGHEEPLTVGKIAEMAGMTEPVAYRELASLSSGAGAGLITFINMGDGRNMARLTPLGSKFRDELQKKIPV